MEIRILQGDDNTVKTFVFVQWPADWFCHALRRKSHTTSVPEMHDVFNVINYVVEEKVGVTPVLMVALDRLNV